MTILYPPLAKRSFTGTRWAAGSYVNGRWVDGATTALSFEGSIQPASGQDLLLLPEGMRDRDVQKLYTDYELFTADQSASNKADRVTVDGRDYEVFNKKRYFATNAFMYNKMLLVEDVNG